MPRQILGRHPPHFKRNILKFEKPKNGACLKNVDWDPRRATPGEQPAGGPERGFWIWGVGSLSWGVGQLVNVKVGALRGPKTYKSIYVVKSMAPHPINRQGLVTSMAPKPLNLYALVASMAPNLTKFGLVTSRAPNPKRPTGFGDFRGVNLYKKAQDLVTSMAPNHMHIQR